MAFDLNVQFLPKSSMQKGTELERTLSLLAHCTFSVYYLLTVSTANPIPPSSFSNLTILSRLTIILEDPSYTQNLHSTAAAFDILAVRPLNEKLLQMACNSLQIDLISLDMSQRLPFILRHTTLGAAVSRGVCFEICYSPGLDDPSARRNLISNAAALIRATRGRGIIISSEAKRALDCRGPYDVINLACLWGLKQDHARAAITSSARAVVLHADTRRNTFKGVIKVVEEQNSSKRKGQGNNNSSMNAKKTRVSERH